MARSNTNDRVERIDRFHKTGKGCLAFGAVEIIVAYLFISLAINSGSVWQYLTAIILGIGAINNLIRAFMVKTDGKNPAKKH